MLILLQRLVKAFTPEDTSDPRNSHLSQITLNTIHVTYGSHVWLMLLPISQSHRLLPLSPGVCVCVCFSFSTRYQISGTRSSLSVSLHLLLSACTLGNNCLLLPIVWSMSTPEQKHTRQFTSCVNPPKQFLALCLLWLQQNRWFVGVSHVFIWAHNHDIKFGSATASFTQTCFCFVCLG